MRSPVSNSRSTVQSPSQAASICFWKSLMPQAEVVNRQSPVESMIATLSWDRLTGRALPLPV